MGDVAPAVLDLQGIGLGDVSDRKSGRGAEGSEGTDATFLKKKVFDNSMRRSSSSLTEDAETPKGTVPVKVFQWPSSPSSAAQKQDKNMDTQRTDTFGKTEIVVNSVPLEGAGNNYASRGDGVPTITRNPSAADSVVDGWNPNALRRLSSKYDTDNEDSTLRQSRPASRRGQIPCFSDLPEGDEATNDASGGNMRLSVPPTTFNTASYNSAGVGAALSPIHSVRSSVVDLSQPISLDALRDTGMFSLTPSSGAGGKHARKRSHTRRPSIVPVDHENDSDSIASDCQAVSEDGSSSSSCPSPSSSDDDADDERDMSRASSESTTDGGNKRDAAPAVVDTSGDDRSISVASEAAVPAPMMVMGPNGFASPSIQAPPAPSQQAPPLADPKSAKSKGDPSSCPVNDPFFFNGPDGNKTSVFGSPAPSDRLSGVGAGIGNPEIVVGDANSRMFGSNPISATDANNSSLWAAAAAAAHRRNATTISLSSELRNMDSASRMDPETETPSVLRQALRVLGLVKSASRVMPGPGPNAPEHVGPTPPAPDSSAIPNSFRSGSIPPTPVKPANIVDEGGLAGILSSSGKVIMDAPVSGDGGVGVIPPLVKPDGQGHGVLGKTPMISPSGSSCSDTDSETSDSSEEVAAQARAEVEGDVEEGGVATAAAAAAGRGSVEAATAARVDTRVVGPAQTRAMAAENQTVLPNAPTDAEKVLYLRTGRFGMITCALLSFYTLSTGMWLFTIVSPAFYWFGVPAVFLMLYLMCHYFGIAMWGRDFQPKTHEEVRKKAEEDGYQPPVDVFLPVCKEPTYLLANTWTYVRELNYPNYTVHVLDDGACDDVKELAEEFGFNYIVRTNRPELKKAGNLRYAFTKTTGEAIAIFDADFCPRPDFLKETVPYLNNSRVGIVQTPQYFRYKPEQTWIEKGAGVTQEFFYRLVQMNQDRFNAAVCVGSCGLYRRAALEPFGGMAPIAHSEDMYTGFKMTEHGYSIKYVPLNLAMGACPDEPVTFFMQQYRWCMGSASLMGEKGFWNSSISKLHKLCFINGMLYYVATSMLVFLAPVPILLLVWIKADGVLWYHSLFALPSIIFAAIIMPCWSKQRYGMACHRVKIIQCYAHMYAIKDRVMGRSAPWVPSGAGGSSRAASATYRSSVKLMLGWNTLITFLIVGGSAWRMTAYTWYHFIPAIVLAVGSLMLNISTLFY